MRRFRSRAALTPVLDMNAIERPLLIAMLTASYIALAALGRDVFFNSVATGASQIDDPIGAHLHKIRFVVGVAVIGTVCMTSSVSWAFQKVPVIFAPFVAWALLSISWADPENRGPVFYNAVILTVIWLSFPMLIHRIGLQTAVGVSLRVTAWVCIISFLLAVFLPSIGVHQAADAVQNVHAGRWRGIFAHKNGLGPWAAFGSVLLFTHSWMAGGGSRLFWWFARFSAVCCLFFCGSATAILMAGVLIALNLFFAGLKKLPPVLVVLGSIFALAFAAAFYFGASGVIFDALGRDSSFTGRDKVWALAIDTIAQSPWLGHGYYTSGGVEFLQLVERTFSQDLHGPESGYLCLLLDLGVFGFLAFFIPCYFALRNGFEWLNRVGPGDRAGIEYMMMILIASLLQAIGETAPLLATGFDGVNSFGPFFALMTIPKSPVAVERSEQRLAKSWIEARDDLHRRRSV